MTDSKAPNDRQDSGAYQQRVNRLATFNSERARGILHTEAWLDLMSDEQEWWNQRQMSEMLAQGGEEVSPGVWMLPGKPKRKRVLGVV